MSWQSFKDAAEDQQNLKQQGRMELVQQIRLKLKEYRSCSLCIYGPQTDT
jgi:hypothetical protein